jgi:hypothetical protein
MNAMLAVILLTIIRILIPFGLVLLVGSWFEHRKFAF